MLSTLEERQVEAKWRWSKEKRRMDCESECESEAHNKRQMTTPLCNLPSTPRLLVEVRS